jgi:hypothetical protein
VVVAATVSGVVAAVVAGGLVEVDNTAPLDVVAGPSPDESLVQELASAVATMMIATDRSTSVERFIGFLPIER